MYGWSATLDAPLQHDLTVGVRKAAAQVVCDVAKLDHRPVVLRQSTSCCSTGSQTPHRYCP